MRVLFWLLVVANAACFVWWYTHPVRAKEVDVSVSAGGKSLVMLQERGLPQPIAQESENKIPFDPKPLAPPTPPPTLTPTPTPPPAPTTQCYALGPYATDRAASGAISRLSGEGITAELDQVKRDIPDGFWVMLPPYPSRQEAKAVVQQLVEKGVEDFYILPSDETNANAISLGLYSGNISAERRANQVRALGFNAIVAPRFRQVIEYWLNYEITPDAVPSDEFFASLSEASGGARQEQVVCQPEPN